MKKASLIRILLALCVLLAACGGQGGTQGAEAESREPSAEFPGGSGTEEDPYLLRCPGDLWLMAARINGAEDYNDPYRASFYRLEADLDLGGQRWIPISKLDGGFDGGGHTIRNFTIGGDSDSLNYGLIAELNGALENLTISDAQIRTERKGGNCCTGAFAGRVSDGTLRNCRTTDSVSVFSDYDAGGIAGSVSSSSNFGEGGDSLVENCVNEARVESSSNVGAAAGISPYLHGNISGCINQGEIVSAAEGGGIACGLAGHVYGCENHGSVHAGNYAGGICCSFSDGALSSSNNDTSVILDACVNTGNIISDTRVAAGICGRISTGTIRDCSNTGDILSANEAGGIFGYIQLSSFGTAAEELHISGCSNSGSVSSTEGSIYSVGGIGGQISVDGARVFLEDCENSGIISCENANRVGGILGDAYSSEKGGSLSFLRCKNSGAVTGREYTGGILGVGSTGSLGDVLPLELRFEACENSGAVTGCARGCCVGGITGGVRNETSAEFIDCSNTGKLSAQVDPAYFDDLMPLVPED